MNVETLEKLSNVIQVLGNIEVKGKNNLLNLGSNVTEPTGSGSGYARLELTSLSVPTDGVITNTADIQFNESLTDWFGAGSPATHYVIFDSKTGGNLLMYNELTNSRIIESNTVATINASSLYMKLID